MEFIAYYRVSTDRQGKSGLGLDAQRSSVASHIGTGKLIAEFTEVESGKGHSNRPQLLAALAECRKKKAVLVIAKLDRLARNVHFITGLIEGKVEFVCCDNPHANKSMLQMMAVFAEHEREQIAERTKLALRQVKEELKRNGSRISKAGREYTKLGNPNIEYARTRAIEKIRGNKAAPEVCNLMRDKRKQGKTLRAIAEDLNKLNIRAPRGGQWYATSVKNQLDCMSL